jgi:hypothetical protein
VVSCEFVTAPAPPIPTRSDPRSLESPESVQARQQNGVKQFRQDGQVLALEIQFCAR